MEHGPITLQREQAVRLLGGGIRFFLGAALTASQTAGGYAPFALGLVAAAGPGMKKSPPFGRAFAVVSGVIWRIPRRGSRGPRGP